MLQPISTFVYERRRGLAKAAGVAGAVYLIGYYVKNRLEEIRDKVNEHRAARESLKRRFQQTQEDISYTVMALIPTLARQILDEMDVETLTHELQTKSRTLRSPLSTAHSPPAAPSESSLASSIVDIEPQMQPQMQTQTLPDPDPDHDVRSESGSLSLSLSLSSLSGSNKDSNLGEQSQLVETSSASPDRSPARAAVQQQQQHHPRRPSPLGDRSSESVMTFNSGLSSMIEGSSSPSETSDVSSRSKAELWKEVKILTFTRTLTVLYSTTLLSLFTAIQLTLLGRSKYVQSVRQLERDERIRERFELDFSPASVLFGGFAGMLDYGEDADEGGGGGEPELADADADADVDAGTISEDVEMKYLTLSWWILHVGWKDVGERVRRGVEEVFDSVSLKIKLGPMDLHRLVSDVRRRVEHEITFEGHERRINFISTLLPPTPETLQHILIQGGLPPRTASSHTQPFTALLAETRAILTSPDFERVLEVCLDRATGVLFEGLQGTVFAQEEGVEGEGKMRLAGLLPGLARWSHVALDGLPNELVDGLMDVREVSGLSAIAFAKFEDRFS